MKRLPRGSWSGQNRSTMVLLINTFRALVTVSEEVSIRPARRGMPMALW